MEIIIRSVENVLEREWASVNTPFLFILLLFRRVNLLSSAHLIPFFSIEPRTISFSYFLRESKNHPLLQLALSLQWLKHKHTFASFSHSAFTSLSSNTIHWPNSIMRHIYRVQGPSLALGAGNKSLPGVNNDFQGPCIVIKSPVVWREREVKLQHSSVFLTAQWSEFIRWFNTIIHYILPI